jgi:hypothetical protein
LEPPILKMTYSCIKKNNGEKWAFATCAKKI